MAASGAIARAQLAAAARAASGARASGLRAGPSFAALCAPPAWLTAEADERERIGGLAALLSVAPALRACVDGRVLGPLADAFGDDVLEAALDEARDGPEREPGADVAATPEALRTEGARIVQRATAGEAGAVRLLQRALALPRVARTTEAA